MGSETTDILQGAAILAVVLACAYVVGRFLNRAKNSGFVRAWTPLIPVINGTVVDDGGGAASSWLTGTFAGRRVHAQMVPNRNTSPSSGSPRYNHFEVGMEDVPGASDWQVLYHDSILSLGKMGRYIASEDAALTERLCASGLLEMVTGMRTPHIIYRTVGQKLIIWDDLTPDQVPTPEQFAEQMALLVRLEQINRSVNAPEPPA